MSLLKHHKESVVVGMKNSTEEKYGNSKEIHLQKKKVLILKNLPQLETNFTASLT
jgi:hypothetical protein